MEEEIARYVLGIPRDVVLTRRLCQAAFRKKALLLHPDKLVCSGDEEAFIKCNYARDFLLTCVIKQDGEETHAVHTAKATSDQPSNTVISNTFSVDKGRQGYVDCGDDATTTMSQTRHFDAQEFGEIPHEHIHNGNDVTPMDIDSCEETYQIDPITNRSSRKRSLTSNTIPPIERFGQIRAIAFATLRVGGIARDDITIDQILSYLKKHDLLIFKSGRSKLESSGNLFACEKAPDSAIKSKIASRMRYYPIHFVKEQTGSTYRMSPQLLDRCIREFR